VDFHSCIKTRRFPQGGQEVKEEKSGSDGGNSQARHIWLLSAWIFALSAKCVGLPKSRVLELGEARREVPPGAVATGSDWNCSGDLMKMGIHR
jgi:hypothetical protein